MMQSPKQIHTQIVPPITAAPLFLQYVDDPGHYQPKNRDKHFRLAKDFTCRIDIKTSKGEKQISFTIPEGMFTDFASIPPFLRPFLPRVGRYGKAAVVHDYFCSECEKLGYPKDYRKEADKLFRDAMEQLGVPPLKKFLMFQAVRRFGQLSEWSFKASAQIDLRSGQIKEWLDQNSEAFAPLYVVLNNRAMQTTFSLLIPLLVLKSFIQRHLNSF